MTAPDSERGCLVVLVDVVRSAEYQSKELFLDEEKLRIRLGAVSLEALKAEGSVEELVLDRFAQECEG